MTTPPTTPGQDGGERPEISDEIPHRLVWAACGAYDQWDGQTCSYPGAMRLALAAVAPDLVRAERDRVRAECAREVRAVVDAHTGSGWDLRQAMYALVNRLAEAMTTTRSGPMSSYQTMTVEQLRASLDGLDSDLRVAVPTDPAVGEFRLVASVTVERYMPDREKAGTEFPMGTVLDVNGPEEGETTALVLWPFEPSR